MNLRRRRRPAGRASSRGQSLVEFALVFPIFILLLAGMIDFGIGLFSYMTINNAARDSVRFAATNCTQIACKAAVETRAINASSGLGVTATLTCGAVNCAAKATTPGDTVTVHIHYDYKMVWPLAFGTTLPMDAELKMLAE